MISVSGGAELGSVGVVVTQNEGHSVEFWAGRLLGRLISVSDTAPPPIRDQAQAFKSQIEPMLVHYMQQAIKSDRTTLHNQLKSAGQLEAANLILKL
jgi:hypothetical protein